LIFNKDKISIFYFFIVFLDIIFLDLLFFYDKDAASEPKQNLSLEPSEDNMRVWNSELFKDKIIIRRSCEIIDQY
jgi:hypothetical protein